MYDSRARERRRQIEEQEALATKLLRQVTVDRWNFQIPLNVTARWSTNMWHIVAAFQRLSEAGQRSPDVEVRIRVPLEKEVPLSPVIEDSKLLQEKPEFPELSMVLFSVNNNINALMSSQQFQKNFTFGYNFRVFIQTFSRAFPVKEMEAAVNRAFRGGSPHEVLSEGFGLSLTRKDLQTLSNLNWLNDEVSARSVHQSSLRRTVLVLHRG